MRKSLLGRFLGVFGLVAACSVAATAWLAVETTSAALNEQQGQALADNTRIYNALLGYAATHPQWDGVGPTLRHLASQYGVRISLTTQERRPLGVSGTDFQPDQLPVRPSAVVDPLSVDSVSFGAASTSPGAVPSATAPGRIDARAVGPFRLPQSERDELRRNADRTVACLRRLGQDVEVIVGPTGRPRIEEAHSAVQPQDVECPAFSPDDAPTPTERTALQALTKLTNACLNRQGHSDVTLNPDFTWQAANWPTRTRTEVTESPHDTIGSCLDTARREQLSPYVARPALLFIGDAGQGNSPGFNLTTANRERIFGAALLVLALTIGAAVVTGRRLVRPLHRLTAAAEQMKQGSEATPIEVHADDEIGRLTDAFNDMADHRKRSESQRKALVSDVAHELRTPLSNLRGWLEAVDDGLIDPSPDLITSLLEEAVQLQHLINDLQDLAQADAGALRLHLEAVTVTDLLHQSAAAHQAEAERTGITLTSSAPEDLPTLAADPVRVRQAISNLLSNALRHTPEGGRVILRAHIDGTDPTHTDPGTAQVLKVEVADTGSGITAEDLPYVFDRFWRADTSRNRHTGGSGLGLAIVHKLAQAHGGTVTVTSQENVGTTFTLLLPVDGPKTSTGTPVIAR
ncbi:sensor histidine kinase [Streptomyces puniciscabiei]